MYWPIKDAVNDAARECSLTPPSSWLASTDATHIQFRVFLRAVADELLQRHDWADVTTDATFDGPATQPALPSDFLRLANYSTDDDNIVYELSPRRRPLLPLPNRGDWTKVTEWNATGVQRYYRLRINTIKFLPPLEDGGQVMMAYVRKTWVLGSDLTTFREDWESEDDNSYLPASLLQRGLIWRWRRHKGLPYADHKAEFETSFARYAESDYPLRRVSFSRPESDHRNPMRIPVPDYIPPA